MPSTCFVLMPFNEELNELYDVVIKPCAESLDTTCIRSDALFDTNAIIADINKEITQSTFVIADLTDRNPNVFYELGLAHARGKAAILITQQLSDVPFDLRHLRCIEYKTTPKGLRDFDDHLRQTISNLLSDSEPAQLYQPQHALQCYSKRDLSRVSTMIASATEFCVLDTTLSSFVGVADELTQLIQRGGSVRMLTLDPECEFTRLRNEELGYGTEARFAEDIRMGAFQIWTHVAQSLDDPRAMTQFCIRKYTATPSCVAVISNENALVSWLLRNLRSRMTVHVEAPRTETPLWAQVSNHFDFLWHNHSTDWVPT